VRARVIASVPSEKQVEAACDRLMAALGFTSIHFSQTRATRQTPGIPDRKYYRDRLTFWLEVKRPGGKQSQYQRDFQKMCTRAGETYVLGGLDELTSYLRAKGLIEPSHTGTWKPTSMLDDALMREATASAELAGAATTYNGDDDDSEC